MTKAPRDGWVVDEHAGGHREPRARAIGALAGYSNQVRETVRIASYTPEGRAVFVVESGAFAGRPAYFQIATDPRELAVGQRFVAALNPTTLPGHVYVIVPIDSDEDARAVFAAIGASP